MALLLQLDASPNVVNVDNDEDLHQESESDSETVSGSDAASDVVDDDSSAPPLSTTRNSISRRVNSGATNDMPELYTG